MTTMPTRRDGTESQGFSIITLEFSEALFVAVLIPVRFPQPPLEVLHVLADDLDMGIEQGIGTAVAPPPARPHLLAVIGDDEPQPASVGNLDSDL